MPWAALSLAACLDGIPDGTITPPSPGGIRGRVTDHCQGQPLAGVGVMAVPVDQDGATPASTVTDAAGEFALRGLAPGTWQVTVSRATFRTRQSTVAVESGQDAALDLALSPEARSGGSVARLDLLFVVDNSNSMEHEQRALGQVFSSFLDPLLLSKDFLLDLRLGVVTTDMGAGTYNLPSCETAGGDGGKLRTQSGTAGCPAPRDPYISVQATAGGVTTNVSGDLVSQAFACLARVGTGGCGFEQPLAAALKALDGTTNPGFPRQGAALGVVVVSDEDDCSARDDKLFDPTQQQPSDPLGPLTSYRCFRFGVTCAAGDPTAPGALSGCKPAAEGYLTGVDGFVKALGAIAKKNGAPGVFFAALAGPATPVEVVQSGSVLQLKPSCQTPSNLAVPAVRLRAVADTLQADAAQTTVGAFESICSTDFTKPMANLSKLLATAILASPCR